MVPVVEPGFHFRLPQFETSVVIGGSITDNSQQLVRSAVSYDSVRTVCRVLAENSINGNVRSELCDGLLQDLGRWAAAGPLHVHGEVQDLGKNSLVIDGAEASPDFPVELFRSVQRHTFDVLIRECMGRDAELCSFALTVRRPVAWIIRPILESAFVDRDHTIDGFPKVAHALVLALDVVFM